MCVRVATLECVRSRRPSGAAQGSFFFNRALAHFDRGAFDDALNDLAAASVDPQMALRATLTRGDFARALGRLGACPLRWR